MSAESMFSLAGTLVLPGWCLLILLPRWQPVTRVVTAIVIPAILASVYVWLLAAHWSAGEGGFGSLAAVARLFENDYLLLAGWIHYLAFDLFVGSWEVRDARENGLHHVVVVPCLLLTFLAGPAGLLLYLAVRSAAQRRFPATAA